MYIGERAHKNRNRNNSLKCTILERVAKLCIFGGALYMNNFIRRNAHNVVCTISCDFRNISVFVTNFKSDWMNKKLKRKG